MKPTARAARPLLPLALLLAPAGPGLAQDVPPVELDPPASAATSRWGVGVAYGAQQFEDETAGPGEAGSVAALQLSYRTRLDEGDGAVWLFELGLEHAVSTSAPETAPGRTATIRSNGVFYRFNRYFGASFHAGGRVGFSRVRGPEGKRNLDLVVGLQAGVSVTRWLDLGVELVAAEPSGTPAGRPADLRGIATISF